MKIEFVQVGALIAVLFFLAACPMEVSGVPEPRLVVPGDMLRGRRFVTYQGGGPTRPISAVRGANGLAEIRKTIPGGGPKHQRNPLTRISIPEQIHPGTETAGLRANEDPAANLPANQTQQPNIAALCTTLERKNS
jgi:hypothetical protein